MMERREFLKAGAAGVVAAGTGCGTSGRAVPAARLTAVASPEHVANLAAAMDRDLAGIRTTRLLRELVPADVPIPRDDRGEMAALESFLQKGILSLYVSGTFLEQPPEVQAHPDIQRRVVEALPVMHETVRASTAVLADLTQTDPEPFQRTLRRYPDLAMRVAETIDAKAGDAGISGKRRMQLRLAAMEITSRFREQHPAAFADECLRKTNKVYVRRSQTELARKVAAAAAEQMFWAPVVAAETSPGRTVELAPYAPSPMPTYDARPVPARLQGAPLQRPPESAAAEEPGKPGTGVLKAAGWMFGMSITTLVAGMVLVEAGVFPGVFGITFGVIGLFAALITALVGLIIRLARG